jgi:hypothetical protein
MVARNRFTPQERSARSRLAQLLHEHDVICGSVVSMARTCGKAGCRCAQGEKHLSLYLSTKVEGKRRMVYLPPELEDEVRKRVAAHREVEHLTDVVSAACVSRVLERKRERKSDGKERQKEKRRSEQR